MCASSCADWWLSVWHSWNSWVPQRVALNEVWIRAKLQTKLDFWRKEQVRIRASIVRYDGTTEVFVECWLLLVPMHSLLLSITSPTSLVPPGLCSPGARSRSLGLVLSNGSLAANVHDASAVHQTLISGSRISRCNGFHWMLCFVSPLRRSG